jgi:hypothetical protein
MVRLGWLAIVASGAGAVLACESDDDEPGGSADGGTAGGPSGSGAHGGTASGGRATSGGQAGSTGGANSGTSGRGAATGGSDGSSGKAGGSGGSSANSGSSGDAGDGGEANGAGSDSGTAGTGANGALPEGNSGIAARHPGDLGIETDAAVVFADDFERYSLASDLDDTYDAVYQYDQIRIATEAANVYAGEKSLEFSVPQQDEELSNATDKVLSEERDVLFLRYYSKFMAPFDVVGSSHNGSSISAHYFVNGNATPGVPADGTNKFLAAFENWRGEAETPSPGHLNIYLYHPEQRDNYGDHLFPTGLVMPNTSIPFDFGPDFVPRDDVIQELDRWYCYEYMLKANTPGERDGRIAFWLDGVLLADFMNLRLRDVPELKIDRFGVSLHIGSNPNGVARKWFDNVVAATSYIGPLVP